MSAYIQALIQRKRAAIAESKARQQRELRAEKTAQEIISKARDLQQEIMQQAASEHVAIVAEARGPIGPMPKHQWRGSELRFEVQPGKWGKRVDLRGPPGAGAGGAGAEFRPGSLSLLSGDVLDTDALILERDGVAYRVTIATLKTVFGTAVPADAVMADADPVMAGSNYVIAS